jgi:hypothetical protein
MSKLSRNKISRKEGVGDSFSLTQTHVETTQVVCSQAHDREGGSKFGLDRPCIQTEMNDGHRVRQTTIHRHENIQGIAEKSNEG